MPRGQGSISAKRYNFDRSMHVNGENYLLTDKLGLLYLKIMLTNWFSFLHIVICKKQV